MADDWYICRKDGSIEEQRFPDVTTGMVAFRMIGDMRARLIHSEEDIEYAFVNGEVKQVYGTWQWWDRQERYGEKEFLETLVAQDRWRFISKVLGDGRSVSQAEVDTATDVIQWLGTTVGVHFMTEALGKMGYKVVAVPRDEEGVAHG